LAKYRGYSVITNLVCFFANLYPRFLFLMHISGQMESTLLESFLKAGKLKFWLAKPDCPAVISECKQLFDRIYAPKVPDSDGLHPYADSLNENAPMSPRTPPDDLRVLLKDTTDVVMPARARHGGIVYSTSKTHLGNSLVQFYPHGNRTFSPVPGSIKYVYREGTRTYLAIQRQLPAGNISQDPFALYPHFPAKIYSSQLSQSLERIQLDWIFSHYARWNFSPEYAVVLSLNRVRISIIIIHTKNPHLKLQE
jgi:hypothetical protein